MIELDQIIGQQRVLAQLRAAYEHDRLPHGLIFAGPIGVGKRTTATALGKLFLCEMPGAFQPCGRCASCTSFDAGTHPDFHFVRRELIREMKSDSKARDLGIDVVRDYLVAKAANSSVAGKGKVFLVREADRMSAAAQNALLKTLEEPAGRTLIILLTAAADQLLPTIHSRCQLLRFGLIDTPLIEAALVKQGIATAEAQAAAVVADGSLGLAIDWLASGVVAQTRQLDSLLQSLAAGRDAPLTEFLKSAADGYAARELERDAKASKDQATREGLILYLSLTARWLSRQLASAGEEAERFCSAIDVLREAEILVDANVNIPLVLQQVATALPRAIA